MATKGYKRKAYTRKDGTKVKSAWVGGKTTRRKSPKKKILKKNIWIDNDAQRKEKNIYWRDYPCFHTKSGRPLKKNLGDYFSSWEDYLRNSDANKDWRRDMDY